MIQHWFNRVLNSRWHHGIGMKELQRRQRVSRRQGGILAAAVLLHVALLALPLRRASPPTPASPVLEVSLLASFVTARESPTRRPAPAAPPTTKKVSPDPQRSPRPLPKTRADTQRPEPTAATGRLTVARLLDQATRMNWPETHRPKARIGRPSSSESLGGLRRQILPLEPNLFDDYALPASVETIDRWLEPGGAHRVVVRTPTGHTLCGRQEPVDVFRPWGQMPMMFHLCAGGGQRQLTRTREPRWR